MTTLTVALAITGHGFGHAVRCAEVARALTDLHVRTLIRTDAPAWLFPASIEHLPSPGWPLDVGVAQHGGLDLDIDETRRRRSEEHTSELQSHSDLVCRLLLEKKKQLND